uniref:Choline/carnitine acyltransferase domain-containing protein n=1 Tax=Micrurus corallinus TaxID=54390 RepID=A0A2D4FUH2_MICCO
MTSIGTENPREMLALSNTQHQLEQDNALSQFCKTQESAVGPVVPDGYGVCYNPMEEHINFAISAFNSCSETNAARMSHYLEQALLDMQLLLQSNPKSKL